MIFALETVTGALLKESWELFAAHHIEVSNNPEMILDPDPQQYIKAQEAGFLRWFTMREEEHGKAVGYFTFFVTPFLHHVKVKQAHQGLLYIHPDHRGPYFPVFVSHVVQYLTAIDQVKKIYLHSSPLNNLHVWFERHGLELVDRVYELDCDKFSFHIPERELSQAQTGDY